MKPHLHHVPNALPSNHTRDDYDFDYRDGVWGPIRVSPANNCLLPREVVPMIWCRRHGWEKEVFPDPDKEVFKIDDPQEGRIWGWKCPTCGRFRTHANLRTRAAAEKSLADHRGAKDHTKPVSFRLHGPSDQRDPHPAVVLAGGAE